MQGVRSQQFESPGEEHWGYGKQVWLLFTSQSYLFHSFSCGGVMVFGMSTQSVVSIVCADTPSTTQVGDYYHPPVKCWAVLMTVDL